MKMIGLCEAVTRINAATGLRLSKTVLHDMVRHDRLPVRVNRKKMHVARYFISEADLPALIQHFKPR